MNSIKKYCAEFIGTFVLVLFGCGVAAVTGCKFPEAGYIATALSFGFVIAAMAYSVGNVSGCHINPAVSLAMLIGGKMTFKDFLGYVVSQFAGAFAGTALLRWFLGKGNLGQNALYDGNIAKSFVIETVLTFVFVFAVLGVTSKKENGRAAGLVIALSLTLVHLLGIPFTGTSVNPARSLAPAVFVGGDALKNVWVFILAPLVGGAIAAYVNKMLSHDGE